MPELGPDVRRLLGANDVANSWATSVASRSLTYLQAMLLASAMEFSGSVGVGARVADTIRTKVVKTAAFTDSPAVLMLGMMCAVIASSVYLTLATRLGMPVSTTHSIMGGVIGMGFGALGPTGIQWVGTGTGTGAINSGVIQVFLAWIIAPGLSGCFGAIIFTVTKYGVMLRSNPVMRAFALVPVYFAITGSLLTMLLLWKGGNYTINLTDAEVAGTIVGAGAAWGVVIAIFLLPWLYRIVVKDDWQLRFWHIPLGPLLLRRGPPPPAPEGVVTVKNFYEGRLTKEQLDARRAAQNGGGVVRNPDDVEAKGAPQSDVKANPSSSGSELDSYDRVPEAKSLIGPKPQGLPWYSTAMLFWYLKWTLLRGVDKDVVNLQRKRDLLSGDLEEAHAHAAHYDNRAEYMYSFLQIMTAATASFTHGANDVSNAIGPYATIYEIWNTGVLPPKDKSKVPTWILVYGGTAIVIGLWTYGYNIMKNLGNKITLQSPSRGFSMELGSACTVILATRLSKLPRVPSPMILGSITNA